jgi:hypothetical protein
MKTDHLDQVQVVRMNPSPSLSPSLSPSSLSLLPERPGDATSTAAVSPSSLPLLPERPGDATSTVAAFATISYRVSSIGLAPVYLECTWLQPEEAVEVSCRADI